MDTDHKETQILVPNSTDLMPKSPENSEQPQQREVSPPLNHICDICGKGFWSGQALGGHKSMHFRESEAIITAATPISRRDPICCLVCGKDFFDKRLLFAHLRNHHEGYTSSNSSTVSEEPMINDGVDSGSSSNLTKKLPPAWPPTGKRKRRTSAFGASSSDCSAASEEAAPSVKLSLVPFVTRPEAEDLSGLEMLSQVCTEEATQNLINDNKGCPKFVCVANKRRRLNDEVEDTAECNLCKKTFTSYQALGGHMSSHNRNKINAADHDDDKVHSGKNSEQQLHSRYRCNVCDRAFSSFQALGGHKSSHCKDMDREKSSSADVSSGSVEVRNERQSQTAPHQCKTCFKIFPTGQALGGHQRLHYKGRPTEAPAKVSQQNSAPRLLDFDLNETPSMEDIDGPSIEFDLQLRL